MSDFFGKAKTNLFRATQKISEKLGRSEETIDLTFNQEKERFELHYKNVKKVNETTIKVLSTLRGNQLQPKVDLNFFFKKYSRIICSTGCCNSRFA